MASYYFAGLYGVAIASAGMMSTTAMQLAIDAFGPIADNAGGIAEMSQLPPEVRERTDNLDAVGNTTAATGKGFAIASAALTSLALFAAFVGIAGIDRIDIYKANVLAGLFVGGMIPFIFSALCIQAVGKAAMDMVQEVRTPVSRDPGHHGIQSPAGIRKMCGHLNQGLSPRNDDAGSDRPDHSGHRWIYLRPRGTWRFAGGCYRFGCADGYIPVERRRCLGQCQEIV